LNYLERKWTDHERQSVQDRALQQSSSYLLPMYLDETELPSLHSTTGYLDARAVYRRRARYAILFISRLDDLCHVLAVLSGEGDGDVELVLRHDRSAATASSSCCSETK
jgi:hypothetical protein